MLTPLLVVMRPVGVPEYMTESVEKMNRTLTEGTLEGFPTDRKSIMKKQLKILEYVEKGFLL